MLNQGSKQAFRCVFRPSFLLMLVTFSVTLQCHTLRGTISTPCPAVFSCRGEEKRGAKEKKKRREKEKKEEREECVKRRGIREEEEKKRRGVGAAAYRLLPCSVPLYLHVLWQRTAASATKQGHHHNHHPPALCLLFLRCSAFSTNFARRRCSCSSSVSLSFFLSFLGRCLPQVLAGFPLLFCTHQDQRHGGTGESGGAGPVGAVGAAGTGCSVVCPTTTVVAWPLAPNRGTGSGVGVASPSKSSRACLRVACLGIHPPACPEDGALSIAKVTHSPLSSP